MRTEMLYNINFANILRKGEKVTQTFKIYDKKIRIALDVSGFIVLYYSLAKDQKVYYISSNRTTDMQNTNILLSKRQ